MPNNLFFLCIYASSTSDFFFCFHLKVWALFLLFSFLSTTLERCLIKALAKFCCANWMFLLRLSIKLRNLFQPFPSACWVGLRINLMRNKYLKFFLAFFYWKIFLMFFRLRLLRLEILFAFLLIFQIVMLKCIFFAIYINLNSFVSQESQWKMGRVDNVMFSASKKGKQAVTPKQFALLFAPIPSKIRIPAAICEEFFIFLFLV